MTTDVRSELISRNDLGQMLLSTWQVNENLAAQLPLDVIDIYRSGFRSAISAIATAYQLELPNLENTAISQAQPSRELNRTRHDMRL
ncbi:MAG: hypothetical protein KF753_11970 [Caldilineaceae bacterium]|nr:hypothetical protein [Caldilineaceae bacterium]